MPDMIRHFAFLLNGNSIRKEFELDRAPETSNKKSDKSNCEKYKNVVSNIVILIFGGGILLHTRSRSNEYNHLHELHRWKLSPQSLPAVNVLLSVPEPFG